MSKIFKRISGTRGRGRPRKTWSEFQFVKNVVRECGSRCRSEAFGYLTSRYHGSILPSTSTSVTGRRSMGRGLAVTPSGRCSLNWACHQLISDTMHLMYGIAKVLYLSQFLLSHYHQKLNKQRTRILFLTGPDLNITVNKINISQDRYWFSHAHMITTSDFNQCGRP